MDVYEIAQLEFDVFTNTIHGNIDVNILDSVNESSLLQAVVSLQEEDGYSATDTYQKAKWLLEQGVGINHQSKDGRTALHDFFFESPRPSVQHENNLTNLLLTFGIDINLQDNFGATAFQYAIANNALSTSENKEMYIKLLQAGVNYYLTDEFNHDIIYYCHEFPWRTDVLPLIKEYGQYE